MAKATSRPAFDVVIVGAGVAGALLAWRLGSAGIKVALLEAGPDAPDRTAAVADYFASPSKGLGSPYPGAAAGPEHEASSDDYYDQAGPEKYLSTYERIAGGSTWHWLGHTPRLLPNDFRLNTVYGQGVDWPIGYDELEPWYGHAEQALGVAGDDAQWANIHGATRSKPFPMPPIWPSWSDNVVAHEIDGLEIFGEPIKVLATPAARNSRPYDGRPPCAGNASCIPICPIGAKYDGGVHVGKAIRTGQVKLIVSAIVTHLHVGAEGKIEAVDYLQEGHAKSISGRFVIVCANAIESAKLLLMSDGPGVLNGVANSSGEVGRNLMDHMQKSVFLRTRQPVYPFRGPPSTAGIETFRDGLFRKSHAAMRFSLNNDGFLRAPNASPVAELSDGIRRGLFGAALRKQLFDGVSRQLRISLSTELLPDPNNRVTLSSLKDDDGLPRPRISFNVGDYTRAAFVPALSVIEQIADKLGAEIVAENKETGPNPLSGPNHYNGAGHVMGTCRMGFDASNAVVDRNCRTFDHPNLYIVGASVWPTCGTANPTLTVAAISLRAADHIARSEFGRALEVVA